MRDKHIHNMNESDMSNLLSSSSLYSGTPDGDCLSDQDCASLADGKLTGKTLESVTKHLSSCSECLDKFTTVANLGKADTEEVTKELLESALALTKKTPAKTPPLWRRFSSMAASVMLVMVAGLLVFQVSKEQSSDLDSYESGDPQTSIVRNIPQVNELFTISIPADGASVERDKIQVQWTSVEQGLFFDVLLLSDDGDVIWQGRTEEDDIVLPSDLDVVTQQSYFILVRANLREGKVVQTQLRSIKIAADR